MNPRRLYRCRHDRQLAGVAAGMAEYLDIDPTVVRILWILSIFLGGFGILLYIILAFVIPLEPVSMVAPTGGAWGAAPTTWAAAPAGEAGTEPGAESTAEAAPGAAPATAWGQGWQHPPIERQPSRLGLYVGVMLVVFGAIAMVNVMIPGLVAGGLLGAGFLVALGVALLVGATRPSATDR